MSNTQPKELQDLLAAEPDLVDRIFEYLLAEFPHLGGEEMRIKNAQAAVRAEFAGQILYIQKRSSREMACEVLRLFDGRNATEVARRLGINRATVYRYLKQAGK